MNLWICCCIFFCISLKSNAQIFDPEKTAKRTETKVKNRVNRKVDNTINDGLDEVFNQKKSTSKSSKKASKKENENSNVVDAEYLGKNDFVGQFRLEIETSEKGKIVESQSGNANYYFFETKSVCIPKKEDSKDNATYIFDLQEKAVTIIKEKGNKKMAIIQNRPLIKIVKDESTGKKPKMEVTKLTATSMIEGKKCLKYLIEEENCVTTLWVTSELPYNFRNLMLSATFDNDEVGLLSEVYNKVDGLPLRVVREYKTEEKTVNIYIRNIVESKPNNEIYSISGCEVTDLRK